MRGLGGHPPLPSGEQAQATRRQGQVCYPHCLLWGGGRQKPELPPPLLSQAENRRNICWESRGSVSSKLLLGTRSQEPRWLWLWLPKGAEFPGSWGAGPPPRSPRPPSLYHCPAWSGTESDQGTPWPTGLDGKELCKPSVASPRIGGSWGAHVRAPAPCTDSLIFDSPPISRLQAAGPHPRRRPSPASCTWLYFTIVWIQLHNTLHPKLFLQLR